MKRLKRKYAKYDPSNWSKQLYELKRSGYITVADGSIQFTNKGKMRAIETKVKNSPSVGKYRFISFDIPEQQRKERDAFRRTIKRVGFRQLQRSLWVCNKDISDYVELAAYDNGVEDFVVYIVSEKSDIDGVLDKMFLLEDRLYIRPRFVDPWRTVARQRLRVDGHLDPEREADLLSIARMPDTGEEAERVGDGYDRVYRAGIGAIS